MSNENNSLINNGFLQTNDASKLLGVSDRTLRERASSGHLEKRHLHGRAYYRVFFNSTEMASRLGVSRSTIRRMAERNEVSTRNINGRTFYYTNPS